MWIKICANTNLDDALLAVELGADALGFVFAASTRQVTADKVAAITCKLPATVEKIGVFSTHDASEIIAIVHTAGLTGVQLHNAYTPNLITRLCTELQDVRVIQTIHWNVSRPEADSTTPIETKNASLAELEANQQIAAVLVDSRTAAASGGTGVAFDWSAARQNLAALVPKPLIVAGGLTPDNVQQAIAVLRPWGVDVASGVEARPGRKDSARLQAFLSNARANLR